MIQNHFLRLSYFFDTQVSTLIFNGNSRILKRRYCTIYSKAIFCWDSPLHRPYIGLIYGRYLQSRILKWPLISWRIPSPSLSSQTHLFFFSPKNASPPMTGVSRRRFAEPRRGADGIFFVNVRSLRPGEVRFLAELYPGGCRTYYYHIRGNKHLYGLYIRMIILHVYMKC